MAKLNFDLLKGCGAVHGIDEMAEYIAGHNNCCRFCVKGGDRPCGVGVVEGVCRRGVADWLALEVPADWSAGGVRHDAETTD